MPRYFFDLSEAGQHLRDEDGTELRDHEAAVRKAFKILGEIARDEQPNGAAREFVVTIREDDGEPLLRASLMLRLERCS